MIAAAAVSMLFLLGPAGALAQQPATPPAAAPAEATPASRTLALVAGKPVTEADVEQRAADSLKQIRREYERNIDPAYLERLNGLYEAWIKGFKLCPALTIPTDDVDYVHCADHERWIIQRILSALPPIAQQPGLPLQWDAQAKPG